MYPECKEQSWRTEPHISDDRKAELAAVRDSGFAGTAIRLTRADIEWLLATHENGLGPVIWDSDDQAQQKRKGINLEGAILELIEANPPYQFSINLSRLPLAELIGQGLNLKEADLAETHLECADLDGSSLEGARLTDAHLEGVFLNYAKLASARLRFARLTRAVLIRADLTKANLHEAKLQGANLSGVDLTGALLEKANLTGADMERVKLKDASLGGAILVDTNGVGPKFLNVDWTGFDLNQVDWSTIEKVGEEKLADEKVGEEKIQHGILYQRAEQTYLQLAVALGEKKIDAASNYTYRAQIMQRKYLWHSFNNREKKLKLGAKAGFFGRWLPSWILSAISGYGYRLGRAASFYAATIGIFGFIYFFGTKGSGWKEIIEAMVASVNALHGRAIDSEISTKIGADIGLLAWTGVEAVVGLIVEITLIVTITQRFFKK